MMRRRRRLARSRIQSAARERLAAIGAKDERGAWQILVDAVRGWWARNLWGTDGR